MMAEDDGDQWIPTRNHTGFISSFRDACTDAFIKDSLGSGGPALEIGAGYGFPSLRLLGGGHRDVTVNDVSHEHLEAFLERVPPASNTPKTVIGDLTADLTLPEAHYQTILVSRVIHFFDGPGVELAARRIASWLAPGGRLFVIGDTIYAKLFAPCLPTYEARQHAGWRWPGYFTGLRRAYGNAAPHLPDTFHFFDEQTLPSAFVEAGLQLEDMQPQARADYPEFKHLDGREALGCTFRKELR